ncbi:MAG: HupE/UreJ family protein [Burkholderiales bacterium]
MPVKRLVTALAKLLLVCAISPVHSHKPSDSYLALEIKDDIVAVQWDIALRDLHHALGLDRDNDGAITWGELKEKHRDIASYTNSRLALGSDGKSCAPGPIQHLVDEHSDGAYAVLKFSAQCVASVNALEISYGLLFDLDPQHRGLLRLSYGDQTVSAIFSPEKSAQRFELSESAKWRQFLAYCGEGIWHIWIGFDHILFLLSLLLPSVLIFSARKWQASPKFGSAFWEVFKIVTAFTLAHSITLSLAALEVIQLPSRWVESAIAASVVIAALNNIFPVVQSRRWIVAFLFGLIHGFGFASVLTDLGLPKGSLLIALVAFNVGVEIGQLAIVSTFLPIAFWIRETWFYQRALLTGGSAAVAALASLWLIERIADVQLLGA